MTELTTEPQMLSVQCTGCSHTAELPLHEYDLESLRRHLKLNRKGRPKQNRLGAFVICTDKLRIHQMCYTMAELDRALMDRLVYPNFAWPIIEYRPRSN